METAQTPSAQPTVPAVEPQTPSAPTVPASVPAQSPQQPVPAPQTPAVDETAEARIKSFQSRAEQERIEKERYRQLAEQQYQEAEQLRQRIAQSTQHQQTPTSEEKNPFDPATQFEQWDDWRLSKAIEKAVRKNTEEIISFGQKQQESNLEMQWQQAHPEVNILDVKRFAQMRGIKYLDDAYALMPKQQIPQAPVYAPQIIQQPIQPQVPTGAIRNGVGTPQQPVQLSLQKDIETYLANPNIVKEWGEERTKLFFQHVAGNR